MVDSKKIEEVIDTSDIFTRNFSQPGYEYFKGEFTRSFAWVVFMSTLNYFFMIYSLIKQTHCMSFTAASLALTQWGCTYVLSNYMLLRYYQNDVETKFCYRLVDCLSVVSRTIAYCIIVVNFTWIFTTDAPLRCTSVEFDTAISMFAMTIILTLSAYNIGIFYLIMNKRWITNKDGPGAFL